MPRLPLSSCRRRGRAGWFWHCPWHGGSQEAAAENRAPLFLGVWLPEPPEHCYLVWLRNHDKSQEGLKRSSEGSGEENPVRGIW